MNERINKLAQLAGLSWAEDVGCGFPDIKYPPGYEKFAEAFVKECIETLRLVPYNSDREFGDEVIYQDAIRKHFGVE